MLLNRSYNQPIVLDLRGAKAKPMPKPWFNPLVGGHTLRHAPGVNPTPTLCPLTNEVGGTSPPSKFVMMPTGWMGNGRWAVNEAAKACNHLRPARPMRD